MSAHYCTTTEGDHVSELPQVTLLRSLGGSLVLRVLHFAIRLQFETHAHRYSTLDIACSLIPSPLSARDLC